MNGAYDQIAYQDQLSALAEACSHKGVNYQDAIDTLRDKQEPLGPHIVTLTRMIWAGLWPMVAPPSSEEDLRPEVRALLQAHRLKLAVQISAATDPLAYEDAFVKLRGACDNLLGFSATSSPMWPQLEKVLSLAASALVSMWSAGAAKEGDEEIVRKATEDFQKGGS